MPWKDDDDKQVIGPRDRIWVSPTEEWELDHFIDTYLQGNGISVNDKNRASISTAIHLYPRRSPFQRDELTAYLDRIFKE